MRCARESRCCRIATWLFALLGGWNVCEVGSRAAEGNDGSRTFYVDSETGLDVADGESAQRAWRSLDRVNAAELRPGDTVRFRSGGTWRGSLVPSSGDVGAPVTYTSFGEGPKPLILGSVPRNRPEDWVKVRESVWATLPMEYRLDRRILDLHGAAWSRHQEAGARIELATVREAAEEYLRIASASGGSASNHVQLWGPELAVEEDSCLVLTFRARSNKPFRFPGVDIVSQKPPWTGYGRSGPADRPIGAEWDTYQVAIEVAQSSQDGRLHVALGGLLPAGAVFDFQPQSVYAATPSVLDPLAVDVGNIIIDGGAVCGWKKWSLDDLAKPYDYFYDGASRRVYLRCEVAPPARHKSIELALARHVVDQGGKHHVVYDGLAVMYGAAHGFGGGNTHDVTIRNCDLGYMGGAHQHTRPDGRPVRFGNAIEFWGAARDNLVEGCRIWEVYDAALTNQGSGADSKQINITYRNNLIRNAEYSFEYWNNPESAVTENIRFVNNTCVNAGGGWAHAQRPDPNGSHLMFYTNTAATAGIEIRYNIFCGATDWGCRYSSGWKVLPAMDHNLWFNTTGVAAYWFREKIADFDAYRQATGLDAHSRFADPRFVDAARYDFRLDSHSPARTLRSDGGPVGAEMLW